MNGSKLISTVDSYDSEIAKIVVEKGEIEDDILSFDEKIVINSESLKRISIAMFREIQLSKHIEGGDKMYREYLNIIKRSNIDQLYFTKTFYCDENILGNSYNILMIAIDPFSSVVEFSEVLNKIFSMSHIDSLSYPKISVDMIKIDEDCVKNIRDSENNVVAKIESSSSYNLRIFNYICSTLSTNVIVKYTQIAIYSGVTLGSVYYLTPIIIGSLTKVNPNDIINVISNDVSLEKNKTPKFQIGDLFIMIGT